VMKIGGLSVEEASELKGARPSRGEVKHPTGAWLCSAKIAEVNFEAKFVRFYVPDLIE